VGTFMFGRILGIHWNMFTYGFEKITITSVVLVK
jgi:hypothetical protein